MANMFRPLRADEIDCRISQIAKDGTYLTLLLYKDARCDQNILDETVGPKNWQRGHTRDNRNCIVSIWDEEKGQWIEKEDTGTESNTEREKGLASDSFKRACFNWGIGRELYTAPYIKITKENADIKQFNGKWSCYDHFSVRDIVYDGGKIVGLKIYSPKKRKIVYSWGKEPEKPEPVTDKPEAEEDVPQGNVTTGSTVPPIQFDAKSYIADWLTGSGISSAAFMDIRAQLIQEGKVPDKKSGDLNREECNALLSLVQSRVKKE